MTPNPRIVTCLATLVFCVSCEPAENEAPWQVRIRLDTTAADGIAELGFNVPIVAERIKLNRS